MKYLIYDEKSSLSKVLQRKIKLGWEPIIFNEKEFSNDILVELVNKSPEILIIAVMTYLPAITRLISKINRENLVKGIIVYTYDWDDKFQEECLSAGADFFFSKPQGFRRVVDLMRLIETLTTADEKKAQIRISHNQRESTRKLGFQQSRM